MDGWMDGPLLVITFTLLYTCTAFKCLVYMFFLCLFYCIHIVYMYLSIYLSQKQALNTSNLKLAIRFQLVLNIPISFRTWIMGLASGQWDHSWVYNDCMGHRGEEVKADQRNHGPSGQDRIHKSTSLKGNHLLFSHSIKTVSIRTLCASQYARESRTYETSKEVVQEDTLLCLNRVTYWGA